ncbi:MAG: LamG domain-containing protein, partial [Kiritimatiellia bacterium]
LNEPEDGIQVVKGSSRSGLTGLTHARSLAVANGMVGGARRVGRRSGSSASWGNIVIDDPKNLLHKDLTTDELSQQFTVSFWMKWCTNAADYAYLVSHKLTDEQASWGVQYDNIYNPLSSRPALRVWTAQSGWEGNQQSTYPTITPSTFPTDDQEWHHVAFVYGAVTGSRQAFTMYCDGESVGSMTLPSVAKVDSTYKSLVLGGLGQGHGTFNGEMDEARVTPFVRPADWVRAERNSMSDPEFLNAGAVYVGAESAIPVVRWSPEDDSMPVGVIDYSYSYVQFAGEVDYCGFESSICNIEYKVWPEGSEEPATWTSLTNGLIAGDSFAVPVKGLKLDTDYLYELRAVNDHTGGSLSDKYVGGAFRTSGNGDVGTGGKVLRIHDRIAHVFTTDGAVTLPEYATNDVSILVVGGGGAGGYMLGGGGGGGEVYYVESLPESQTLKKGATLTITVGKGGTASSSVDTRGGNGGKSTLVSDDDVLDIETKGGGAGGNYNKSNTSLAAGAAGGSGGGGSYGQSGGAPTGDGMVNQGGSGNNGVNGGESDLENLSAAGGGGGAVGIGFGGTGEMPPAGGMGGAGFESLLTGKRVFYGAGGGGGVR